MKGEIYFVVVYSEGGSNALNLRAIAFVHSVIISVLN